MTVIPRLTLPVDLFRRKTFTNPALRTHSPAVNADMTMGKPASTVYLTHEVIRLSLAGYWYFS